MKIWFDTEFIEDGKTIDLLSIGMVKDDGSVFYAECAEADHSKASDWVKANVLPHLTGRVYPRHIIAEGIKQFVGAKPEIWAYYADYDWVALCQLYGTMMDLPKGWPMYCRDVKQLCDSLGNPKLPEQVGGEHHALSDAKWTKQAWEFLMASTFEADDKDLWDALNRRDESLVVRIVNLRAKCDRLERENKELRELPKARKEGYEHDVLPTSARHAGTECSEPGMRSPEPVTGRRDGHFNPHSYGAAIAQ